MIRRLTLVLTASIVAFGAQAAPIELREQIQSRERELVNVMFSTYLSDRVGASVQTAVVDMDGDGVGEIIARFVHTNSCDAEMKRCRTAISKFEDGKWHVVFDRYAVKIEDVTTGLRQPGPIKVDGQIWDWNRFTASFIPEPVDTWQKVDWIDVPADQVSNYAPFFGDNVAKLLTSSRNGRISYAKNPLSKAGGTMLLKLDGSGICGTKSGCPIRVIQQKDNKWNTVLATTSTNDVFKSVIERDGINDIVVSTQIGFANFGWNGNSYSIADRIESNRKKER